MNPPTNRPETPTVTLRRHWPALMLSVVLWLASGLGAAAATLTWTGAINGNWGNNANWNPSWYPQNIDTLVFPVVSASKTTTNNLSGVVLRGVVFAGSNYVVYGYPILTWTLGASNLAGLNSVYADLFLNAGAVSNVWVAQASASLYLYGDIHLNGYDLSLGGSGTTHLNGVIQGTRGVVQNGPGSVYMAGSSPNTYEGGTFVNDGILRLNKPAGVVSVPGPLQVGSAEGTGTVRLLDHHQIATDAAVDVRHNGTLDLNGYSNTVASLTFVNGGTVTTDAGRLELGGNVTATSTQAVATITGRLHLGNATRTFTVDGSVDGPGLVLNANLSGGSIAVPGGGTRFAGLIKAGTGEMELAGANTYDGATTVNEGILSVSSATGLGSTLLGTAVHNDARLWLNGVNVGTEDLTLNSTNGSGALCATGNGAVAGDVILQTPATIAAYGGTLTLNGPIRGTGDLTLGDPWYPGGTFVFGGSTSNLYAGVTWLRSGTLVLAKVVPAVAVPGPLIVGDGQGLADGDVVRLLGNYPLGLGTDVTIASSGLLDLNGYHIFVNALSGLGHINLNRSGLTMGIGGASSVFGGTITGTNGLLRKHGIGTLTLTGTNTFTGTNQVNTGTLIVNGHQPNSVVVVSDTASRTALGGSGTVGHVFLEGGWLVPGTSPGLLTCSNLVMFGPATFSPELNGTIAGTGYDQLKVRGSIALANPALEVAPGIMPTEGNRFTILNNETVNPVTGAFAGLPEGALVSAGPLQFRISYVGGSGGNDVVLTFTNASVQTASTSLSGGGNGNGVLEPNECNYYRVVVTNGSGLPMSGVVATLVPATPGVAVPYPTSAYPDIAGGGRGTNLEPFQITTWPSLPCGANIELDLKVETATHGHFTLPVSLRSGSPGVFVPYGIVEGDYPIGGINYTSTVNVGGFSEALAKVTLSLHLSDTTDGDLDLNLIGPDGTVVALSTGNGGTGTSYGSSCRDRTVFDDGAMRSITTGSAPFAGTYRPEGPLTAFRDQPGNGFWRLWIRSRTHLPLRGTLHCWTVNLYRFQCADGGGVCESCPDRTIYGLIGDASASQNRRLLMNGDLSRCELRLKPCPGPTGAGSRRYDAYTFVNGESNACITVSLTSRAPLFSAAYLGSYNPTDLCENYRADRGSSAFDVPFLPYSFEVPANARFVVVVNEVDMGITASYTLTVSGGSCRPVLHTDRAGTNAVALDWTTAAVGYQLEQTNALVQPSPPAWPPSPAVPTVVHSRFHVTNSLAGGTNGFYRLRKP